MARGYTYRIAAAALLAWLGLAVVAAFPLERSFLYFPERGVAVRPAQVDLAGPEKKWPPATPGATRARSTE